MSTPARARTARRSAGVAAAVITACLILASLASAHVEVESEGARALAENATLSFSAATESASAGINKLEVFLPKGITPADVTYEEGPEGWKFAATKEGFTVSGPAMAVGEDAAYSVVVRQLPDAKSLVFKTLQSYDDGRVDRWIEVEKSTGGGHGHSAPVLELEEAAPGAELLTPSPSASSAPAAPSPSTPPASETAAAEPAPSSSATATKDEEGSSLALPIGVAVAVVALAGGLWWFLKRRGTGTA
ncbi:DUF1775 domain-containing protein [Streptomyces microflavus]|uniref:DUF1775 domain-containing protein n=1 Tax=Streptomyces microflavus TaxID=1919 RepID=UPI00343FFDCA